MNRQFDDLKAGDSIWVWMDEKVVYGRFNSIQKDKAGNFYYLVLEIFDDDDEWVNALELKTSSISRVRCDAGAPW